MSGLLLASALPRSVVPTLTLACKRGQRSRGMIPKKNDENAELSRIARLGSSQASHHGGVSLSNEAVPHCAHGANSQLQTAQARTITKHTDSRQRLPGSCKKRNDCCWQVAGAHRFWPLLARKHGNTGPCWWSWLPVPCSCLLLILHHH